jgi:hypothetical protein
MYTSCTSKKQLRSNTSNIPISNILNPRPAYVREQTHSVTKHHLDSTERELLRPLKKSKIVGSALLSSNNTNVGPKKQVRKSKTMGVVKADYSQIKSKVDHRRQSIQPNDSGIALDHSIIDSEMKEPIMKRHGNGSEIQVDENSVPLIRTFRKSVIKPQSTVQVLKPQKSSKPLQPINNKLKSKLTVLPPTSVKLPLPITPRSKKRHELDNISFTSVKNPFSISKPKKYLPYFDPLLVEEYEQEIYEYWRNLEMEYCVDHNYMSRQPELEWEMRQIMISWLVQIHSQFKMNAETLHLAIHLIDRTMSNKTISVSKLQLVGVSALLIAAKFEEILAPSVQDLSYFTDYTYSGEEIIRAERHLLGIVRYQIGYPSPLQFLRRMIKGNSDFRLWNLSSYFIEVLYLGNQFLIYPASQLAASSLFLSIKVLYDGEWVSMINIRLRNLFS